jgi:hypothetical protein
MSGMTSPQQVMKPMLTNATYKIYFSLPEKWNTYEDYSGLNVEWCYETGKPEHVRVTGDLDSITKGPFFTAAEGNREFRIDRGQDTFAPTQFIRWDGRHLFNLFQSWAGDFFVRHIASINGLILYGRYHDPVMRSRAILATFAGKFLCVDAGSLTDFIVSQFKIRDERVVSDIAIFLLVYESGRTTKWGGN